MERKMDMEFIDIKMVVCIKGIGSMTVEKVKEHFYMLAAIIILDNGIIIKNRDKEF